MGDVIPLQGAWSAKEEWLAKEVRQASQQPPFTVSTSVSIARFLPWLSQQQKANYVPGWIYTEN